MKPRTLPPALLLVTVASSGCYTWRAESTDQWRTPAPAPVDTPRTMVAVDLRGCWQVSPALGRCNRVTGTLLAQTGDTLVIRPDDASEIEKYPPGVVAGITRVEPRPLPGPRLPTADAVRLMLNDGTRFTGYSASARADTLWASPLWDSPQRKGIPLLEIRLLEAHRVDVGKTVGLLLGVGAALGVTYLGIMAAMEGMSGIGFVGY